MEVVNTAKRAFACLIHPGDSGPAWLNIEHNFHFMGQNGHYRFSQEDYVNDVVRASRIRHPIFRIIFTNTAGHPFRAHRADGNEIPEQNLSASRMSAGTFSARAVVPFFCGFPGSNIICPLPERNAQPSLLLPDSLKATA